MTEQEADNDIFAASFIAALGLLTLWANAKNRRGERAAQKPPEHKPVRRGRGLVEYERQEQEYDRQAVELRAAIARTEGPKWAEQDERASRHGKPNSTRMAIKEWNESEGRFGGVVHGSDGRTRYLIDKSGNAWKVAGAD